MTDANPGNFEHIPGSEISTSYIAENNSQVSHVDEHESSSNLQSLIAPSTMFETAFSRQINSKKQVTFASEIQTDITKVSKKDNSRA